MGRKDHCAVPACRNDRRKPTSWVVKSHVQALRFHRPRPAECQNWSEAIGHRQYRVTPNSKVCSNHFKHGYPSHDDRLPTLFLNVCISNDYITLSTYYRKSSTLSIFLFLIGTCRNKLVVP